MPPQASCPVTTDDIEVPANRFRQADGNSIASTNESGTYYLAEFMWEVVDCIHGTGTPTCSWNLI